MKKDSKEFKEHLKRVGFKIGNIPWNKGTKGIMKPPLSGFKKGYTPWNKGKKMPEISGEKSPTKRLDVRKKISKALKGHVAWNKGLKGFGSFNKGRKHKYLSIANTQDKVFIQKRLQGLIKKPNKPEKLLIELLNENFYGLFQYTGDGKVIIEGFCPDFVCNPNKKIIELFGDYWHKDTQEKDKRRLETYSKYGFQTLIIWESELKEKNKIINKIFRFLQNG